MIFEHFSRSDVQERIKSVILAHMFNNPFKSYNSLNRLEKLNFKREMNKYIKENLQTEDWEDILIKEYNSLVVVFMDDPNVFNPANYVCETNFQPEFILSPEQKEFYGDVKSHLDLCADPSVLKQLQSQKM